MPRGTEQRTRLTVPPDPALVSTDLESWAGERIARSGRKYALMSRVESLRLNAHGDVLEARVRGSGSAPHSVEVRAREGFLVSRCTCPFDWGPVCKHAVAAVEALRVPRALRGAKRGARSRSAGAGPLAAPWALAREERVAAAREQELAERVARARRAKARVRLLGFRRGRPRFEVAGTEGRAWLVALRGEKYELGSCTCPDFAENELGTCKHVERVRAWFRRRKKPVPRPALSLWWRPREWAAVAPAPLSEIRIEAPAGQTPQALLERFDSEGWLREAPPGESAAGWAQSALDCARAVALEAGLPFDLDPLARQVVSDAREREQTQASILALGRGSQVWNEVVPALGIRLHAYQEEGVEFLALRGRAMLADDMGLGKTVQAIAAALLLRRGAGAARALVVCPASIKHQWRQEIHKACRQRALVVEEGKASRLRLYRRWRRGFLVLNYELVLRDLEAIRAARPHLVILDEAQRIKNWDTKTAMAVKKLESRHAFVLTGTPLENRLGELHSLAEFLHPRALGPRWRLLPFHAACDAAGRVLVYEDLDVLRARLAPFFLRRERARVLDQLPARTDNTFWTGMTGAQWRPYRTHAARIATILSRNEPLRPAEVRIVLQALTSMRILCNAYAQYAWPRFESRIGSGAFPDPAAVKALGSPKLEEFARVLEDLLEETESKIVVFSQWERMLRLALHAVGELLARRGERARIFHGGLSGRERLGLLEAFRNEPDLRVLFSTDAGSLGLNLQEAASVIVNLEVPWNPAVIEQRVGRVHRLGQRRSVQVLHFVTAGAIEERVRQVIEAKRALFQGLLSEEADRVVLGQEERTSFVDQLRELVGSAPQAATASWNLYATERE